MKTQILLLAASLCLWASQACARTWVDDTGKHRVEAEFVELKDDVVRLRKPDGKHVSVPVSRLSAADQQYVRDLMRQPAEEQPEAVASPPPALAEEAPAEVAPVETGPEKSETTEAEAAAAPVEPAAEAPAAQGPESGPSPARQQGEAEGPAFSSLWYLLAAIPVAGLAVWWLKRKMSHAGSRTRTARSTAKTSSPTRKPASSPTRKPTPSPIRSTSSSTAASKPFWRLELDFAGPSDSGDAKIRESYELCKRDGKPKLLGGLADGEILWMAQMVHKCRASDKLLSELGISRSDVQPGSKLSASLSSFEPPPSSYRYSGSSSFRPYSSRPESRGRSELRG